MPVTGSISEDLGVGSIGLQDKSSDIVKSIQLLYSELTQGFLSTSEGKILYFEDKHILENVFFLPCNGGTMFSDIYKINSYDDTFKTSLAYEFAKHILSDAPVIALCDSSVNYMIFGDKAPYTDNIVNGVWYKYYCTQNYEGAYS